MSRAAEVRQQLERLINEEIQPIAKRYGYQPQSLNLKTNWRPIVLIIGNYSSGKSTFINEMCGGTIQRTGQAPTDDCFTILLDADDEGAAAAPTGTAEVVEEVPGSVLVNDPSLPFGGFKSFGNRFVSHFQMKKLKNSRLKQLAIIDSPGMLDSVAERDRGYNYQEVVGRLAELADLVVLIFDPYRAGTIKETYVSIRSTLPEYTSEDRVVFVLNRIDECKNLHDLLHCYGVLCWNLSQMTGRKDVPHIYLTYSPTLGRPDPVFMGLASQRDELIEKIEQAPRLQIGHMLGNVDNHLHKLEMLSRVLAKASRRFVLGTIGYIQLALAAVVVFAILGDFVLAWGTTGTANSFLGRVFAGTLSTSSFFVPLVLAVLGSAGAVYFYRNVFRPGFHQRLRETVDQWVALDTRYDQDMWESL
ncbi:MAG: dynamin family protein, partial [Planctomycetia bacterium]